MSIRQAPGSGLCQLEAPGPVGMAEELAVVSHPNVAKRAQFLT